MLSQVCHFIHNYFERESYAGEYTISGGTITLDFLVVGQRFRILGSAANDGIYTYHAVGVVWNDDNTKAVAMVDETFNGTIVAMGAPRELLDLVTEIAAWQTKYADAIDSPFQSESFGGYSYTKATGGHAAGEINGAFTWQDRFKAQLNAWRKIA